jgi:hypothetical protein
MRSTSGRLRLGMFAIVLVLALATLLQAAFRFQSPSPPAESVVVRQTEGEVRGFLVLRALDGAIIADGDSTQVTHGGEVTNRLVIHFRDGSFQEETVVFSQGGHFRLLTDHLVQKGSAFKHPMDISINGSTGVVTVGYKDDKGKDKTTTARLKLPPDLANGMVPIVLKNLAPGARSATASMIVATPKPLLIKLLITADGVESFSTGGASHEATRYVVKVGIGGVRGVLAKMLGKQLPVTRVWILGGTCPTFLKAEGPSYAGGPIWRTELVSPVWQKAISTR